MARAHPDKQGGICRRRRATATLLTLVGVLCAILAPQTAAALPTERTAEPNVVREDLRRILESADLSPDIVDFRLELTDSGDNSIDVTCANSKKIRLEISASAAEWSATLYYGLQKLGFLFPHPRMQISPKLDEIFSACGNRYVWRPRVRYRGFHLHMKHPNEWVLGFLGGDRAIAEETIRWLARNGQNAAEFKLLRTNGRTMPPRFAQLVDLAHAFGIHFGVAVSFVQVQQKSYYMITPWKALTGISDGAALERNLTQIVAAADLDWVAINLGITEFNSAPFERTLGWIETANRVLQRYDAKLFTTIHVSTGQTHADYGNFNFLPQYSDPSVGVLPHTVMFYSLNDRYAPVYGRSNFGDMRRFIERESPRREVWYYPETSYFVSMDIDVPLLLTDYLTARSEDYDHIEKHPVEGHITFTTGHELGYWLIDWTVALLANADHRGRPMIGLELLGEDVDVWQPILDFQTEHIKRRQGIKTLSSSNFLDEVSWLSGGRIHERALLRELTCSRKKLDWEVRRLESAVAELPPLEGVRHPELRMMLEVTWNRIRHAYYLRKAIQLDPQAPDGAKMLRAARMVREESLSTMAQVERRFERYPEAKLFARNVNLTSYDYGYAWPARTLHFWEREEEIVRQDIWNPFFRNIYALVNLVF